MYIKKKYVHLYIYTYIRHRALVARVRVSRGPWECLEGLEDLFIGPTPPLTRVYLQLPASICSIIFLIIFWHRFQPPFGPILEPTWSQLGLQNRPKIGPRATQNAFKILSCFKYLFEQVFDRFWLQLGTLEPSKNIEKPMVFQCFCDFAWLPLRWLLEPTWLHFVKVLGAKLGPNRSKNRF